LSTTTIRTLTLNNGVEMPAFGLGAFQSPPEETTNAVEATIASGYALVETSDAVAALDALDTGVRGGPEPASINPGTFPYKVEND
jgi:diketogulonate reductase-like aldo/keto reductase